MTIDLQLRSEIEGGTEVSVRADHVPPDVSASDHEAGIASSLANLAAYVEAAGTSDEALRT